METLLTLDYTLTYACSRRGLKAPAYSTLAVQAMARIAATEEAEDIRDGEDIGSSEEQATRNLHPVESVTRCDKRTLNFIICDQLRMRMLTPSWHPALNYRLSGDSLTEP
jgi:hypothetical protein